MRKSEKRKIGEARQAKFLEESIESGLKAQTQAHELRKKKQQELMREKARNANRKKINGMTEGKKQPVDDYPEVLDSTDEVQTDLNRKTA
jgi:hypothetical protein